jgi:hypothetical protein
LRRRLGAGSRAPREIVARGSAQRNVLLDLCNVGIFAADGERARLLGLDLDNGLLPRVDIHRKAGAATVVALQFFFKVTLERDDPVRRLTLVSEPRRVPIVLSLEEAARLLTAAPGVKYKAALGEAEASSVGLPRQERRRRR